MPTSGGMALLFAVVAEGVGIICAAHALLNKRRNSASTLAWIVVCVVLPGIGAFGYLTIGQDRVARRRTLRLRKARAQFRTKRLGPDRASPEQLRERDAFEALAGQTITEGNALQFHWTAEAFYDELEAAIHQAKQVVVFQFYIFDDDELGQRMRSALVERAKAGVAVRVLFDAVGCASVGNAFFEPLLLAGAKVAPFMPLRPLRRRWQLNLRNHRKLAILDGKVAFQGSLNVSARHLVSRHGTSLDIGWSVEGPAVSQLLEVFASDWFYASGEDVRDLPFLSPKEHAGSERLLLVASGPDQDHGRFHRILLQSLFRAKSEVRLITPYFVPDPSLLDAIVVAALRGVRVRLCVPEKADHPIVGLAMRDVLRHAVQAGVSVYLKPGPMIHVKAAVIDDEIAIIGSSNLDSRSLFLNFETDLMLSSGAELQRLAAWMDHAMSEAKKLSPFQEAKRGLGMILLQRLAALGSPIL